MADKKLRAAKWHKVMHSVMLAVARLEEAGGRVEDLPAAVEEWISSHLAGSRIRMKRAMKEYVADLKAQRRAPSTIRNRRWRLATLVREVGNKRLNQFNRGVLSGWVSRVGPGSRRDRFSAASAFFTWAWERGYLRTNPMQGMRPPSRPPTPVPRVLTPDETSDLLRTVMDKEPALIPYFAVGLFAGLRPVRELAGLQWEDVALAERRIYVPWGRAKTGRARIVPISANLAAWLSLVPREDRHGKVVNFSREAFRRVVKAWGGKWSTNIMRHTRVSYRLPQCRNPVLVASEGGHTQDVMSRHYANLRLKSGDVKRFWRLTPARLGGMT